MQKPKLANIEKDSWEIEDGEARKRDNPTSFFIPSLESREGLNPEDKVKMYLRIRTINDADVEEDNVEGLWVIVTDKLEKFYRGILDNSPECTDEMKAGMEVFFEPRHIVQIHQKKK